MNLHKQRDESGVSLQDKYRVLFENPLTALFIGHPDGTILEANRAACEMFGYTVDEFKELGRGGIVDPESPGLKEQLKERTEKGKAAGELVGIRKDGKRIWCEFASVIHQDEDGGLLTSVFLIDITDRKETEQKLRHIVEHSTNLFYVHDTKGVLTYVSPQSLEFLGYKPEDVMHHWTEFVTDHPVNGEGERSTERALTTGERQPPYELQLRRADGRLVWVEVSEAPVERDGRVVEFVGSLTDITDRKLAEEIVTNSLKEKEILLAEIHHRVNNNLAIVSSLMELQAMNSPDTELNSQLLKATLRIKSMAVIHEQLYRSSSFSNFQYSEGVRSLVKQIVGTLRPGMEIDFQFELEEVELNINQAVPCSLLINEVVTNIVKHSFRGRESGRIHTKLRQKGEEMELEIEDNGEGLPENFATENQQTMGLMLIDLLAKQLNGETTYESTDSGTCFRLCFKKSNGKGTGSFFIK